ncbi:MAG: hypothetical protein CVV22_04145 [Ignavibacteriae bacterium HGW-Ignavibacteriae-1]|jgi:hypothetical protein|nr:MAG: hypothetical protein CVV22_04145 [Ignavibacteriae bacterium HGW-Ignavibacteriae-1]
MKKSVNIAWIVIPIMLVLALVALLVVAAYDEGIIRNNFLVKLCFGLLSFFSFPFKYFEAWKIFTRWWAFILYFLNVIFWAIILVYIVKLLKALYE